MPMPMRVALVVVMAEAAIEPDTAAGAHTPWLGSEGLSGTAPKAAGCNAALLAGLH